MHPTATLPKIVALFALAGILALGSCTSSPDEAAHPTSPGPTPTLTAVRPTPGSTVVPVPAVGAYFGTHFSAGTADREATITEQEQALGRKFAIDHVYDDWDVPFPSSYDRWSVAQGHVLFLSWTTRRGSDEPTAKWSDIAAGAYDGLLDRRAAAIAALNSPVLMSFDHEPGAQVGTSADRSGSPEEYIAAWRHIVERFAAAGVRNVGWVWTLTAFSFREGDPDAFYPGDEVIDWVGADGYANIECPWLTVPWRSWPEIFGAAADFAARHDKPFIVAEYSAREDSADPGRKAEWLEGAIEAVNSMPALKAIVAFNSTRSCSSPIATSDQTLAAYRTVGASPAFSALVDNPADAASTRAP